MKVAIYARYSSDNQRDASIADQLRVCRAFAERQGWAIYEEYTDHAVSGATLLRAGFQALMRDALNRRFDVVLAESLDRFSRDQEDTAGLFKRLIFAGVNIVTLAEAIFRDFVAGVSPKQVAKNLNREGIAGPFGGAWSPSTIYGNGKRGTGILNNELYIGRLVWNRLRYVKNPDTGKRVSRLNPEAEWMRKEVLELRIVPDDLWTAAKSRQHRTRHTVKTAGALGAAKRPQYLFSGLTKCGICGAGFIMSGKNRLGCFGARD